MSNMSTVLDSERTAGSASSRARGVSKAARRAIETAARVASRIEPLEARVLFSADALRDEVAGFYANSMGAVDDRSLLTSLNFSSPINFYGLNYNSVYVNNNGNITFGAAFSSYKTTSLDMLASRMFAPFFADVDNRFDATPVTYGTDIIDGHRAFGVNYFNVNYYPSRTPHVNHNTFQIVLIDRSDIAAGAFDVEFNYGSIQWETGGLNGGDVNGWGGLSARVGFTAGTGVPGTYFQLAGSGVAGSFLDSNLSTGLANTSMNSDVAGRYLFSFRDGEWVTGQGNTAPTLSVPGNTELTEGSDGRTALPLGFAGVFADPDNDHWTATVDYGDGSGPQELVLNEDQSFTLAHTYAMAGTYAVVVTVSDGNGGEASSEFQVAVVDRSAPVVNVSVPLVPEGGSVTLRANTDSDPDLNDTFTYQWLIGDEAVDGQDLTMSVPDSGTVFVTLIVKDQAGNTTTMQVPVVVENVAPTAAFGASAASTNEGGSVDFSFSGGADVSLVDMAAGLTYSFDFDGDGVFEVTGSSLTASHKFAQDGVYAVVGRVMDKDGGYTDYTATVTVANVAPVMSSFGAVDDGNGNGPVKPGAPLVVAGAFYDPGLLDAHTVTVDWGDGTVTSGVELLAGAEAGSWSFSASHVYGGGGVFTVTLVVDDGAAVAVASTSAKVAGARLKSDGTVEIVGTADADRVDVKRQGKKLVVRADFLEGGEVVYDAADVSSVEVDLDGGKNRLHVAGSVNVPVNDAAAGQSSERKSIAQQILQDFSRRLVEMFPNLLSR